MCHVNDASDSRRVYTVNKVMKNDASKKQTSLLDALDRSFSLSDSPVEQTQLDTPTTPPHGQNTIDHYFEVASSSSKDSNVKGQLRKAREIHDAEQRNAAGAKFYIRVALGPRTQAVTPALLNTTDYVGSSSQLAPPARRGGSASGFGLYYDQETPLRAIDYGGPDQGRRFVCLHNHFFLFTSFVRLADFVTKSIENTSHGLSVKEAMKKLGLNG